MDICLVNPPTTKKGGGAVYFPMSLIALSSFLDVHGFSSKIVDYDFRLRRGSFPEKDFIRNAADDLKENFRAPVYGLTTVNTNLPYALLLADAIKREIPDAGVLLGGPQASSVPREILTGFPSVDAVVVGEGEHTLLEFLRNEKEREGTTQIPGLMCRKNLAGIPFLKRDLEKRLDLFPPADFSKVPLREYALFEKANVGYFHPFIEAGRGCPFDCTFCSTAVLWNRRFRVKSPRRIYEELASLKKGYGFESFELLHDNFTASRKYLHDFCNEFIQINRAHVKWSCASRVDTLRDEDLDLMKKAGCNGVFFGVETGSIRMQKTIKKDIDLTEYDSLLDQCRQKNLRVTAGFILGFPEETEEDIGETIRWVVKSRRKGAAHVGLNRLRVLSGTELSRRYGSALRYFADDDLIGVEEEKVIGIICNNPSLFPSFYAVPHPLWNEETVQELVCFFQVTTQQFYRELDWILNRKEWSSWALLQAWMHWKREPETHDRSSPSRSAFVSGHFRRFLKEAFLPTMARRNVETAKAAEPPTNFRSGLGALNISASCGDVVDKDTSLPASPSALHRSW